MVFGHLWCPAAATLAMMSAILVPGSASAQARTPSASTRQALANTATVEPLRQTWGACGWEG